MKEWYGLFFSYGNITLFVSYSNKMKRIKRYLYDTLHLDEIALECFSIEKITKDWIRDKDSYEQVELIEENGYVFTELEWDVIHREFDLYKNSINSRFNQTVLPIITILSESGRNHWNEIMKEINSMGDKEFEDNLYMGFIANHSLYNNDGTVEAFLNRMDTLHSYTNERELDLECDLRSRLDYT